MAVYVVKRRISPDPVSGRERVRWHVRYVAGRYQPIVHLGSFDTEKRAKLRLQAALDVIARGGVPSRAPAGAGDEAPAVTIAAAAGAWLATREEDAADSTIKGYRHSVDEIPDWLGILDVGLVTHVDAQRFSKELAKRYKPTTVRREIGAMRQILDYAGIRPNPFSDPRVRLPRNQRRAYRLPTRSQLAAMHAAMPSRVPLMLLLEHTGLRIEEAAALRWRDIDHRRRRLLVEKSKTNAGVRWVEHLPDTPPFPEKPRGVDADQRVFAKPSASSLTGMLRVSHQRHGTFLMSSHEFRHLHASRLLHDQVLSPAQIAARLGHTNPVVLLSVYSHVVPPED